MTRLSPKERQKETRKFLVYLAICVILFAASLIYAKIYLQTGRNEGLFACTVQKALGIYCPGCGSSRSLLALLSFDLGGAFFYSPALALTAILLAAALLCSAVSALFSVPDVFRPRLFFIPLAVLVLTCAVRDAALLFGVDFLRDLS